MKKSTKYLQNLFKSRFTDYRVRHPQPLKNIKAIAGQVQIYHFHDWCGQQLKTYHIEVEESTRPYYEQQVESVINAVDKGRITRAQYGALLIYEGHDFEAEWLKLITQMVDPKTDSLLLLYDDAQSIYKHKSGLGFTLSSVGIQAKGPMPFN